MFSRSAALSHSPVFIRAARRKSAPWYSRTIVLPLLLLILAAIGIAENRLNGDVYSPQPGIICDEPAGFCADRYGVSMVHTRTHLGEEAQEQLMVVANPAIASRLGTAFTLSNGIHCDTGSRVCTQSRSSNVPHRAFTRALFEH